MEQMSDAIAFDPIEPLIFGVSASLVALLVLIQCVRIVLRMVGDARARAQDRADMARHGPYDAGADHAHIFDDDKG